MNRLPGKILSIDNSEHFYLIDVDVFKHTFKVLMTEISPKSPFLKKGSPVNVVFKDTEVALGKNLGGKISLRNRFMATVKSVECKKILCKVTLEWNGLDIRTILTVSGAKDLEIQVGDAMECLLKANAVSLMELENES